LDLPKNKYRPVANNLIYYFELNKEIDFADYLTFQESYEDVSLVVKEIIQNVNISSIKEDDMKSVLSIVKNTIMESKIKELKKELKNELDVSRRKKILEEIIEIKRGCVNYGEEE
jgi:UDP-N-acetylmuramate-alanine ligase